MGGEEERGQGAAREAAPATAEPGGPQASQAGAGLVLRGPAKGML